MSKLLPSQPRDLRTSEFADKSARPLMSEGGDSFEPVSRSNRQMIRLTREVRFLLDPSQQWTPESAPGNSWAGWPSAAMLAPYLTLRVTVAGVPDRHTGFICDVVKLDKMLRRSGVQAAFGLMRDGASPLMGECLLSASHADVAAQLPEGLRLDEIELVATPQLSFRIREPQPEGSPMLSVTQQFEFSAAHRLHCHDLSDEENKRLFGKCNNVNGHGHNYVLEVTVEREATSGGGGVVLPIGVLESTVKQVVVDYFDHKHLNLDLPEFRDLNPSVENITQIIYGMLQDRFAPARLAAVRVYETPKTWAEVRGDSSS